MRDSELETTITQKGQVTIPVAVRRELGLKPRDVVVFAVEDGRAVLRRAPSRILEGYGAVSPHGRPEDFRALRRSVEEAIAEDVMAETAPEGMRYVCLHDLSIPISCSATSRVMICRRHRQP